MQKIGCINGFQALFFHCRTLQRLPFSTLQAQAPAQGNTPITSTNLSSSIANFLVKSLGFSTHQSLNTSSALSKRRKSSKNPAIRDSELIEKATCVINFLKLYNFQNSDIKCLIIREPKILVSKVDKTLEPKIKLLLDLGFSGSDLILTVTKLPGLLIEGVGPAILAFKTVLGCNENVVTVLKRCNGIYFCQVASNLIPNVEFLQKDYGICRDRIQRHILKKPHPFIVRPDLFCDRLVMVEKKLGIPRHSAMFMYGLHLACFNEKRLEDKCQVFRSFGWTQSDVTALIMRNPMCLALSEARIRENLDFLMNQLDYKPDFLAFQPSLFTYSVKKRLLPRHRVFEVLKEKGHLRKHYSLASAAGISESRFLKKFVQPNPEVHRVYAQLTGSSVG